MEQATGFKDRRTGLVLFGALDLVVAAICGLKAFGVGATMIVGVSLPGLVSLPTRPAAMVPVLLLYAMFAAFFAALGVGSMLGRRWARALMVIASIFWMGAGVLALVAIAYFVPRVLGVMRASRGLAEHGGLGVVMGVALGVASVFFVFLPLAFFLFYRSPHVKATCEVLDPDERWTDRAPLPVIGLALLASLVGVKLLLFGVPAPGFPLFGTFVAGATGRVAFLVAGALWLLVAWGLYRRYRPAWIAVIVLTAILGISAVVTLTQYDLSRIAAWIGQPLRTADARTAASAIPRAVPAAFGGAATAAGIALLVWMKKYFRKTPATPPIP